MMVGGVAVPVLLLHHDNLRLRRVIPRLLLRSWKKRIRILLRIQQLINHVRYPCWAKRRWISKRKSLERNRLTRVSLLRRWKKRIRKLLKEAAMNLYLRYPCCGAGKIVRMILLQKIILSIYCFQRTRGINGYFCATFQSALAVIEDLQGLRISSSTDDSSDFSLLTISLLRYNEVIKVRIRSFQKILLYLRYPCCAEWHNSNKN